MGHLILPALLVLFSINGVASAAEYADTKTGFRAGRQHSIRMERCLVFE